MKYLVLLTLIGLIGLSGTAYAAENDNLNLPPAEQVLCPIEGAVNAQGINPQPSVSNGTDIPDNNVQIIEQGPPAIDGSTLPDPTDPTSAVYHPGNDRVPVRKGEVPGSNPSPCWGPDYLVYGDDFDTFDWDEDPNNDDLFAIFDRYPQAAVDSQKIYKSTDGGLTWNWWGMMTNGDGSITNAKIRILKNASGTSYLCAMGIWLETTGERICWLGVSPVTSQSWSWSELDDSVDVADIDAGTANGDYLYCVYIPSNTNNDIYTARHNLSSWSNMASQFVDPGLFPYPEITAGQAGNVAFAFIDDRVTTNQEVRVKRSTDYGATYLGSQQVSNNSGAYPLTYTDISYAPVLANGWITVTYQLSGTDDNVGYYYTTDNGAAWTYGGVWGADANEQNKSRIRCRRSTGSPTVAYNSDPGDSVMFTWTSGGSPIAWSAPVRINNNATTGAIPPGVPGWSSSFSAIMYAGIGPTNAWWDWFGNSGSVAENKSGSKGLITLAPNPNQGHAKLSYTISRDGKVRIAVYDASGRLLQNLVNADQKAGTYNVSLGMDLPAGVYFLNVETPDGSAARTMTVVR